MLHVRLPLGLLERIDSRRGQRTRTAVLVEALNQHLEGAGLQGTRAGSCVQPADHRIGDVR